MSHTENARAGRPTCWCDTCWAHLPRRGRNAATSGAESARSLDGAEQLTLPSVRLVPVTYDSTASPAERFLAFHHGNPEVMMSLMSLCLDVLSRGRKRWSVKGAFEVLRWSSLRTAGEDFKLNNNFTAFYARALPLLNPALEGFFAVREQRDPFPFTADDLLVYG